VARAHAAEIYQAASGDIFSVAPYAAERGDRQRNDQCRTGNFGRNSSGLHIHPYNDGQADSKPRGSSSVSGKFRDYTKFHAPTVAIWRESKDE